MMNVSLKLNSSIGIGDPSNNEKDKNLKYIIWEKNLPEKICFPKSNQRMINKIES